MEEEERRGPTRMQAGGGKREREGVGGWGMSSSLTTHVLIAQEGRIKANVVKGDGRGQCFPVGLKVPRGAFSHRGFACFTKSVVRPVPQTQAARVRPKAVQVMRNTCTTTGAERLQDA